MGCSSSVFKRAVKHLPSNAIPLVLGRLCPPSQIFTNAAMLAKALLSLRAWTIPHRLIGSVEPYLLTQAMFRHKSNEQYVAVMVFTGFLTFMAQSTFWPPVRSTESHRGRVMFGHAHATVLVL